MNEKVRLFKSVISTPHLQPEPSLTDRHWVESIGQPVSEIVNEFPKKGFVFRFVTLFLVPIKDKFSNLRWHGLFKLSNFSLAEYSWIRGCLSVAVLLASFRVTSHILKILRFWLVLREESVKKVASREKHPKWIVVSQWYLINACNHTERWNIAIY